GQTAVAPAPAVRRNEQTVFHKAVVAGNEIVHAAAAVHADGEFAGRGDGPRGGDGGGVVPTPAVHPDEGLSVHSPRGGDGERVGPAAAVQADRQLGIR